MTSNIIVLYFEEGEYEAEGMLEALNEMQEKELLELEDAVIVTRGVSKDVKIEQTQSVKGKFALGGSGVGFLAGLLLGGPILGLAGGAAIGAITGSMKDLGIDDKFIKELSAGLTTNSSALFIMVKEIEDDEKREQVINELRKYKAAVISTTLSDESQRDLEEILKKEEYGDS